MAGSLSALTQLGLRPPRVRLPLLDRHLPRLVLAALGPIVQSFKPDHGIGHMDFYAVHAGGPRIFDAVQAALGLDLHGLATSRRVFSEVEGAGPAQGALPRV